MSELPESSTENINEGAVNKRLKLSELTQKVDRLSDLPDCLIHHILSFLPATRDAIRTGVLSKRWQNQWRQVPVLNFHHLWPNYSQNIDKVLNQYERSKIEKFRISVVPNEVVLDPCNIDHKIRFAISRDVKELVLEFGVYAGFGRVRLPGFLFSHTWLVKMQLRGCGLPVHSEKVNWKHLKDLSARKCYFPDQAIENIISGSPLLESLKLEECNIRVLAIASKSLQKLVLVRCFNKVILSCPSIEELQLRVRRSYDFSVVDCNKTTLCGPMRLTENGEIFITSKSLKKLVLENLYIDYVEISCPNLEELELLEKIHSMAVNAVNVQSLNCATLDFNCNMTSRKTLILKPGIVAKEKYNIAIKEFLAQLEHVKKLKFGRQFIECLAVADEKYWSSNTDVFSCSLSNLQIVQIDGLSERDIYRKVGLTFVELLLKNAQMLEKLALIILSKNHDFVSEVSRKLSSVPRCSENATVEISYWGKQGWIKEVIPRGVVL